MSAPRVRSTSARRIVGLVLVVTSPLLAVGVWRSNREPIQTLARFEIHRTQADSFGYANAVYHGTRAQAIEANRWHLTGYATLGTVGVLLGAGLLLTIRYRHDA